MRRSKIVFQECDENQLIELILQTEGATDVHFLNSYNIGLAMIDNNYRNSISRSRILVIDGLVLLRIFRLYKADKPGRQVRGIDFLRKCIELESFNRFNLEKHFFLGSTTEVLARLDEKISQTNPRLKLDFYSPPFTSYEEIDFDEILSRIRNSKPDIVWVGLGTPKQDYAANFLANEVDIPVVAIGAAFDFLAGNRKESSIQMRKNGFEWITRLIEEPNRLWKRYLLISPLSFIFPIFLKVEIKQRNHVNQT